MADFDVVILTESQYVGGAPTDWYTENIYTEDRLVQEALERRGLKVTRKGWDDPDFDWSTTRFAIFRTTWDYFHRIDEFRAWMERAGKQTTFINPAALVWWNLDKSYLKDLKDRGVHIPDTLFIPKGDTRTLKELHTETGWDHTVIKPNVSGAARETRQLKADSMDEHEAWYADIIASEPMMLQPFQRNVVTKGEVSHMVFGGKYSHSVLKIAKEGDFRVQDDFGGTVHEYEANPDEIAFAEKSVAACDPLPTYARVDVIWDNDDQLAVAELELIEPELWFRNDDAAADKLADAVMELH